jgi:hypothetical protein
MCLQMLKSRNWSSVIVPHSVCLSVTGIESQTADGRTESTSPQGGGADVYLARTEQHVPCVHWQAIWPMILITHASLLGRSSSMSVLPSNPHRRANIIRP